jgi:hypothetical protein
VGVTIEDRDGRIRHRKGRECGDHGTHRHKTRNLFHGEFHGPILPRLAVWRNKGRMLVSVD